MKTKIFSIKTFWAVTMLWALHGLIFTTWRTFDYYSRFNLPKISIWYSLKALCYVGIVIVGLWFYKLIEDYKSKGFFDTNSIYRVRFIGIIVILMAIPNSMYNIMRDLILPNKEYEFNLMELLANFMMDFVFESPLFLFIGLVVLLFADFMKKAIGVKNENESFI